MIDLVLLIARLLFVALLFCFCSPSCAPASAWSKVPARRNAAGRCRWSAAPKSCAASPSLCTGPSSWAPLAGADIVIGAGYVSGRHARFQLMGQNLFVEDLGSKNGTAVNGRPVHDPVALRNKDLVTIGDVDIRVRNQ